MSVPAELHYTEEHEWVSIAGDTATVGITDYAAQQLGDVVYVSLPAVGAAVTSGEPCGEVESTKLVSDLYSPLDGEVVEANEELDDDPGLVNAEPYGAGWMFRVRIPAGSGGEAALPPGLLTAAEYEELTKSAGWPAAASGGYLRKRRQTTKQVTLTTARATAPPTSGSIWLIFSRTRSVVRRATLAGITRSAISSMVRARSARVFSIWVTSTVGGTLGFSRSVSAMCVTLSPARPEDHRAAPATRSSGRSSGISGRTDFLPQRAKVCTWRRFVIYSPADKERIMRLIHKLLYPLLVGIPVVTLASCSSSGSGVPSGPAPEVSSIVVDAVPTADEAGLYIANQKGYFRQQGLNIKIDPILGGEPGMADLQTGKAQIIVGNYVSFVLAQISHSITASPSTCGSSRTGRICSRATRRFT